MWALLLEWMANGFVTGCRRARPDRSVFQECRLSMGLSVRRVSYLVIVGASMR